MSNDLTVNPISIDTASSSAILTRRIEVLRVRWVAELASAGDNAVIQDGDGHALWSSVAAGANYVESEGHHPDYPLVCNGLIVPTLQSGTLYLYLKIKTPVT